MTSITLTTDLTTQQVLTVSDKIIGSRINPASRQAWEVSANGLLNEALPISFIEKYANDCVELVSLYGTMPLIKLIEVITELQFQSETSAARALLSQLEIVLRRLDDIDHFMTWLSAIKQLSEVAPNQVEVVSGKFLFLLTKLDAQGFKKWVLTGITSTGSDIDRLTRYFSLEDEASRMVLELEAGTIRLENIEKSLVALPIGLWKKHIILRSARFSDSQNAPTRTSFDENYIRTPISYDGFNAERAEKLFKAAITHIAAHIEYTERREPKALKPVQIAIISILEDTRAELLAARTYPGLLKLWKSFHTVEANNASNNKNGFSMEKNSACHVVADSAPIAENLLTRLARALIDPNFKDDNPWVKKGRDLFFAAGPDWDDPEDLRRAGAILGNDLGQMRLQFNSKTYVVEPPYRDDNLGIWDFNDSTEENTDDLDTVTASIRKEQKDDLSNNSRQQPDITEDLVSTNKTESQNDDTGIPICKVSEWDYLAASQRSDWVTIVEHEAPTAPAHIISGILDNHSDVQQKILKLVSQSKIGQVQRFKRQREGDRLDLDACIQQRIDLLAGHSIEGGIYETTVFSHRDLSVLVLLDISESTKDLVNGTSTSIFHLERAATVLLAEAMAGIGDPFAIQAFCSNGRKDHRHFRLKDFGQTYNDQCKSKLAGLKPGLSTRMGAALRYSADFIGKQMTKRKLVLVITDGEPSDIDVNDKEYLVEDARKAVHELSHLGINVFSVGLDGNGETYLSRIFGQRNFVLIDRIESLPEHLPKLYFRLVA